MDLLKLHLNSFIQYCQSIEVIGKLSNKKCRNIVKTELIGKIVMANYGKTSYYTISDVLFEDIEGVRIERTNNSLRDYYETKYAITLKKGKQPLLVAQNKDKKSDQQILLVPELMLMTGIPENFDEMRRKKISESTIKNPSDKMRQISVLITKLKDSQMKSFEDLGIKISNKMQNMQAKVILAPIMELGKGNCVEKGKEAFFNLFNKPIYASKHNINCAIIYFRGADISGMVDTFKKTSVNLRVQFQIHTYQINGRPSINLIQDQIDKALENGDNICCIVLPGSMKAQYKQVKMAAIKNKEIITQVVIDGTLRKKNIQSISTKVLLQIIAKRGNTLWVPKLTFTVENIMLCAFDHAKLGGNNLVLSMCATLNSTFSSIFSTSATYQGNQNKYMEMMNLIMQAIDSYIARNDKPPKDILLFMNSCSRDQISFYNQLFTEPFCTKVNSVYGLNVVSLTLIMVNGKTSERFFSCEGEIRNVPAGTLINEGLVSPDYDFYLISQNSNRGTTVPNHYRVIFSNSKIEEGMLHEICFYQCFNYVNWTGSIKVPAILQYAKKCARFRAEIMEKNEVTQSLSTKLYFV